MNNATIFIKNILVTGGSYLLTTLLPDKKYSAADIKRIYPKNIFCLAIAGIGDCCMTTPCYELLKKKFPKSTISVLVTKHHATKTVLENNPFIDEIIEYEKSSNPFKIISQLNKLKNRYDTVIAFYPSQFVGALMGYYLKTPYRIGHSYRLGFKKQDISFLYNIPITFHQKHQTELNLELIKGLRVPVKKEVHEKIYLSKKQKNIGRNFITTHNLQKRIVIGIHAGSGTSPLKRWPQEYWIELIKKLIEMYDAEVLLFGGNDEYDLNDSIVHAVGKNISALKTSLYETLALINCCSWFIAHDGGLAHCACALDKPTFVLFGVTDPKLVKPHGKKVIVIQKPHPTMPCYDIYTGVRCSSEVVAEYWKRITPKYVFEKIEEHYTP